MDKFLLAIVLIAVAALVLIWRMNSKKPRQRFSESLMETSMNYKPDPADRERSEAFEARRIAKM